MNVYIPDVILDDYERSAKLRAKNIKGGELAGALVPVHVNVLLGLIRAYRDARIKDLRNQAGQE